MQDSMISPTQPEDLSIDVFSGKHRSRGLPKALLQRRRLVQHPKYGWIYDAWVDSAYEHAVSSPEGRFAIPHMLRNMRLLTLDIPSAISAKIEQGFQFDIPASSNSSTN